MAISKRLLIRDETVVREMRTHPKVLFWRIGVEILLLAVAAVGSVLAPESWNPWGLTAIWVGLLLVSLPLLIVPWLRWLNNTYTVTTKRIITRTGIFNKRGHDLPLSRISDVAMESTITDRIFHCGTLVLQTSADDPLVLRDVSDVEMVQVEISNLLFHDEQGAIDADPED